MPNVTLKDIANKSGYSFSLVSRVLRNKGIDSIPDTTISTIKNTASELGYIVNKNAQSLKMKKTNIIAVVMPIGFNFSTTIFPILTEAIVATESVDTCKMDFVFFNTMGGYKEYENLQEIISLNPDGIIYSVPPKSTLGLSQDKKRQRLLFNLASEGKAIAFLMEKYDIPGTCTYLFDDEAGGYEGTRFLINKGCKKILYLNAAFQNRSDGYFKAMNEFGLKAVITSEIIGFSFKSGYDFFNNLYESVSLQNMPDAVFATSDSCAMGILRAMREKGLSDNDIKIMGFDCIDAAFITDYSYYSVRQPLRQMGTDCTSDMLIWTETGIMPESRIYKPEIVTFSSSADSASSRK